MKHIIIAALMLTVSCTKKERDANTLVLGTHAAYPPYEMVDDTGNISGFDIDVAHAIAAKLGKKLVVNNMHFDALILALKQGKFDFIMAGLSITPSRQKEIALLPYQGDPIQSLSLLFWDKAPEGVSDAKWMVGRTIAVQSGSTMDNYLSAINGVNVKPLEGTIELVMDIKHGKSAAALVEPHIAEEVTRKHAQLKRVDFALPKEAWVLGNGVGIAKNNVALLSNVEKALEQLKREGVIAKLEAKWFHKAPS